MIQATLKMEFASQTIDEAVNILRSIIERIRTETGCISCSVFQDTDNKHMVVFEEKWKSDEDLQRHLRSEYYKKVLIVMEMAIETPEIRFDTIMGTSGVEIIEKARTRKGQ
jgi:quinol monooxygenase YgiN